MRLAIISNVSGYSWAGSEELWLASAFRALETGHRVTAMLHADLHAGEPLEAFRRKGGKVLAWSRGRIARLEPLRQRLRPNFSTCGLGDPDVILVSAGALPALCYVPGLMEFLLTVKVPVVVLCQFNSDSLAFSNEEREQVKSLLSHTALAVFVSAQNLALSRRQFALPLENSVVVFNPIRLRLEAQLPLLESSSETVFACVARFETLWKGQDLLLEILAGEPWRSRSWKLRFFGTGPDLEHVKRYARMLGLEQRVIFEGYERDVEVIWRVSDLMLLPSRGEGTPLAVLEAMMCGRPVVTTNVGGNREVLEDGVTGFIAEAANVTSFGAAMEAAWNARSEWKEIGRRAHLQSCKLAAKDPAGELFGLLSRVIAKS